ncbi:efflux RND transporter permease subunit [Kaarinaea lacus]
MKSENAITGYGRWVVNHPWLALLISILIVVPCFISITKNVTFTSDYRVFFSEDNPQLLAFDELEKVYTKNDNVMFIVSPKDGNVFTADTLQFIRKLTDEAWKLPYSIRVDSIANFQYSETDKADPDNLLVGDLVAHNQKLDDAAIAKIRQVALNEPALLDRIVSHQAHVTGVNVTIQLPGKNNAKEVPEVVSHARNLAAEMEAAHPDIDLRLSGMTMMNNAFPEASKNDMKTLVMASFILMLITLTLMLRNITGTVATLFVIVFSIFVALGIGFFIGFPMTPPSASTPIIVLTVAIANCVHILVTFLQQMRGGLAKKDALVESLRVNLTPVFLASATTAIGFLSMNFSEVPPFQHLGNMVAFGVIASFVFAVFFLPAFMSILPVKVKSHTQTKGHAIMERFGQFVVSQQNKLIWIMAILIITLIACVPRNQLNDIFLHYFDESIEFRRDSDYFTENLSGLYLIDYSLESGEPGGISDPAFLNDVEKLAHWYRQQPETIHVNSISDTMKRLNKNMHGDDPAWYRTPQERDLAAQFLLLYEMQLPFGLDLNNQINIDKSATRFTVSLKTISTTEVLALEKRASKWIQENTTTIKRAEGSGTTIMFANIGKRNIITMLGGTTMALILISMILIVALRSFKIGLVSLIPNLVPAAMGFGLWGLFVGEVGLGLSVVAGMTLGIVVDDTVHFLSKYLRARREHHFSAPDAVRYAFTTVGMALFTTTVVLVIGFLVLAQSAFQLNAGMGLLTAIVICFALLADFLFLPPLLMKLEGNKNEQQASSTNVADTATV